MVKTWFYHVINALRHGMIQTDSINDTGSIEDLTSMAEYDLIIQRKSYLIVSSNSNIIKENTINTINFITIKCTIVTLK